jgi:hypothetical protein
VRRLPLLLASAAVLMLAVPACGSQKYVSLNEGPREYVKEDYDKILERWTRKDRLYTVQGVDDVLSVDATFESWDFRWAYVIRYAEDYRLTIDQRRDLLTQSLADARKTHQFYVALYGARFIEQDLTRPRPTWVARLLDDKGHITAPEEITPYRKPSALERTYFPYTTVWRSAFRLRFPAQTATGPTLAPDAQAVTLRFSGPLGNLELTWKKAPTAQNP